MFEKLFINFIKIASMQLRIMDEFRNLVCQGKPFQECMSTLNLRDIVVLINIIIRAALGLAGVVTLIYLIYSGYLFMTSMGNPDALARAKSKLTNTILGLIIIIIAFAIVTLLIRFFGPTNTTIVS
jgi:hypothetical protein